MDQFTWLSSLEAVSVFCFFLAALAILLTRKLQFSLDQQHWGIHFVITIKTEFKS
jgi:hypothetical protein